MDIERTMLWAGLLGLLTIGLALFTAFQRMGVNTPLGGDDDLLVKKSRAFGNLVEHAPLMLIMMMLLENDGYEGLVHFLGFLFFGCRLAHAYGVIYMEGMGPSNIGRMVGALGSWGLMGLAALLCII